MNQRDFHGLLTPRRNPYGWTFCPIASLTFAPMPVEPAGPVVQTLSLPNVPGPASCKTRYFAAFLAAFLAGAFFAAVFLAAGLVVFLAAGASGSALTAAEGDFFSATVTMM